MSSLWLYLVYPGGGSAVCSLLWLSMLLRQFREHLMSGDVSRKKKWTLIFFFFWYVWTLKTLKHLFTALGQNICIKHSKKWANVISTVWRNSGVDVTLSKDVYVLCNRDVHWSHTVSVTERFIFLSKQKKIAKCTVWIQVSLFCQTATSSTASLTPNTPLSKWVMKLNSPKQSWFVVPRSS